MYADDENPEYDLDLVATWCDDNMLTLNSNKTQSMTFLPIVKRNETIPVFKIRGEPINSVVTFKYLGLILDTNLNFKAHYSDLINSVQYKIHFLSKIRKFLTIKTALLLYRTAILPLIDYGDFIYDQDVHYFNNKLQVLQNRALRIICKSPIIVGQYISTLDLHQLAKLPSLKQRSLFHLLINGASLKEIEKDRDNRPFLTRGHDGILLTCAKPNLPISYRSLKHKTVTAWNRLDPRITLIESRLQCKRALKEFTSCVVPFL